MVVVRVLCLFFGWNTSLIMVESCSALGGKYSDAVLETCLDWIYKSII